MNGTDVAAVSLAEKFKLYDMKNYVMNENVKLNGCFQTVTKNSCV